jgi:hypothetical protein
LKFFNCLTGVPNQEIDIGPRFTISSISEPLNSLLISL